MNQNPNTSPTVFVYNHTLLEGSMTFIKSQAEALKRYHPVYVGVKRDIGIGLSEDQVVVVNSGSAVGRVREFIFRRYLKSPTFFKRLRKYNPSLIHAHFGTCGPAAMSIAEELDIPLIVTFHGWDATLVDSKLKATFSGRELLKNKRKLIDRSSVFIAVSDYIKNAMIQKGYPPEKIIVLRNGINIDNFKPDPDQRRRNIILFVGRFVEKKGVVYLIDAARQLRDSGVDFELVLIGAGPLEDELRRAASQARINCRFTGFLPVEEVRTWLNRSSVVAVPSVVASDGNSEGLPTIILEAQAMETPIVATRHSGIPEGVIEGKTADLVGERDSAQLAFYLRTFLESPQKIRDFGYAGRKFVSDTFDMQSQVHQLEDIYSHAISTYRP